LSAYSTVLVLCIVIVSQPVSQSVRLRSFVRAFVRSVVVLLCCCGWSFICLPPLCFVNHLCNVCVLTLWCCCVVVLWCCGVVVLWRCGDDGVCMYVCMCVCCTYLLVCGDAVGARVVSDLVSTCLLALLTHSTQHTAPRRCRGWLVGGHALSQWLSTTTYFRTSAGT